MNNFKGPAIDRKPLRGILKKTTLEKATITKLAFERFSKNKIPSRFVFLCVEALRRPSVAKKPFRGDLIGFSMAINHLRDLETLQCFERYYILRKILRV